MEDGDPGPADDDERAIELAAISAIYPEIVIDPESPYAASLALPVTPLQPIKIRFQQSTDATAPQLPTPPTSTEQDETSKMKVRTLPHDPAVDDHDLAHLPSLIVHITLPEQYPSDVPPTVRLMCTPPWIPKRTLKKLEDDCEKLWQEWGRAEIVYTYIDHLSQSAENAFGMGADVHVLPLANDLKLALLDFDLRTKREIFEKETFTCGICLEPKKGSVCHRLMLCNHVFCVPCLQDFFNNCITEGDVDSVKCLDPGCGRDGPHTRKRKKQDRTLNPSELLQIPIEQSLVQRFVQMKRKKKLEADKNTIYCPRQWCQGAARSKKHPKPSDPMNDTIESGSDSEAEDDTGTPVTSKKAQSEIVPMSERLSVCEDCSFAFCCVCKKGWHGEVDLAVCNPRKQAELNEEEKASLAYVQRYSTPCPTCSVPCQKSMGCNHMTCHLCKSHFCYLCSAYLMPENPYRHYNNTKSPCYMRLWELERGDGADVGMGYAGGNADWEPEPSTDSDSDEELEEEDFANVDRDDFFWGADDEDSSDEEAAPDQRRPDRNGPMQIELVNAAGQHIIHNIPERPRPAPPVVPAAPPAAAGRNRRRRGQQQAPNHRAPPHQGRPPPAPQNVRRAPPHQGRPPPAPRNIRRALAGAPAPAPVPPEADPFEWMVIMGGDDEDAAWFEPAEPGDPAFVRAAAAPGQGNAAAQQPAPVRAMGLERFLELANNDR